MTPAGGSAASHRSVTPGFFLYYPVQRQIPGRTPGAHRGPALAPKLSRRAIAYLP